MAKRGFSQDQLEYQKKLMVSLDRLLRLPDADPVKACAYFPWRRRRRWQPGIRQPTVGTAGRCIGKPGLGHSGLQVPTDAPL